MRAVFEDLGCSPCAARAMVEDKGIDMMDDLCFLKDGDIETLCKNVKHLGGAMGEQQGSQLRTSGQPKAEMNIKLAVYYLRYSEKIS